MNACAWLFFFYCINLVSHEMLTAIGRKGKTTRKLPNIRDLIKMISSKWQYQWIWMTLSWIKDYHKHDVLIEVLKLMRRKTFLYRNVFPIISDSELLATFLARSPRAPAAFSRKWGYRGHHLCLWQYSVQGETTSYSVRISFVLE